MFPLYPRGFVSGYSARLPVQDMLVSLHSNSEVTIDVFFALLVPGSSILVNGWMQVYLKLRIADMLFTNVKDVRVGLL